MYELAFNYFPPVLTICARKIYFTYIMLFLRFKNHGKGMTNE
jgi:hypothetical protein